MPTTYKILGSGTPAGSMGTWTTIYTVPANTQAIISSVSAANTNLSSSTVGIGVVKSGGSLTQLVPYSPYGSGNLPVLSRLGITEGWTLSAGDAIQVISSGGGVTFVVFGSEIA